MTLRICSGCKREYLSRVPNQEVRPEAIRRDIAARRYIDRHPGQGRKAMGRSFEFYCGECRGSQAREGEARP